MLVSYPFVFVKYARLIFCIFTKLKIYSALNPDKRSYTHFRYSHSNNKNLQTLIAKLHEQVEMFPEFFIAARAVWLHAHEAKLGFII